MKKNLLILSAVTLLFASCTPDSEPGSGTPTGKPVLTASEYRIANDGVKSTQFTVIVDDIDVTEAAIIYMQAPGRDFITYDKISFTATEVGEYQFFANLNDQNSEKIVVTVATAAKGLPADPQPESVDFHNRVMVMQYTGTGCQYCPSVAAALKNLAKTDYDDKMQVISIHAYNDSDPMYSRTTVALASAMSISSYPKVAYNMRSKEKHSNAGPISATQTKIEQYIDNQFESVADAAISVNSVKNGNTLQINIGVKAGKAGIYRTGVFLLEDGIIAAQSGNTSEYEEYDLNTHNNAVRVAQVECDINKKDFSGESLGMIKAGKEGTTVVTLELKDGWKPENCYLVVYVTSGDTEASTNFYSRNIIAVPIEGTIAYQYNK